jgi:LysM repeat protein
MTALRRVDLVPIDHNEDGSRGVLGTYVVPSPARVRRMEQRLKSRIGFTCATALMAGVALMLWDRSRPLSSQVPAAAGSAVSGAARAKVAAPTVAVTPAPVTSQVAQLPAPGVTVVPLATAVSTAPAGLAPTVQAAPTTVTMASAAPEPASLAPAAQATQQAVAAPTQSAAGATPIRREAPAVATPQRVRVHTVEKGDTLFSLARRYGTTVDAIVTVNGLGTASTPLKVGKELSVP